METAKEELGKPFPQEQELAEKLERLNEQNAILNIDDNAVESTETTGTLAYSAQNPMTFIYASAAAVGSTGQGNWYYWRGTGAAPAFWGEAKTMYDPCPVGWKVPAYTVWENNFTTDLTTHVTGKGRYLNANNKIFYPYGGTRGSAGTAQSGELITVTSNGYYWSSGLSDIRAHRLYSAAANTTPSSTCVRAFGNFVRPCQDVNN